MPPTQSSATETRGGRRGNKIEHAYSSTTHARRRRLRPRMGILASFLFLTAKGSDIKMTANTADESFVIDDFPTDGVRPHFCHPAPDPRARVLLPPVEALAAPHSAGHVATFPNIDHRAPLYVAVFLRVHSLPD